MDKVRIALVAALIGAAAHAQADEAKRLATVGNWEAYAYTDAGGKVCYAAARADKPQDRDRAGTAIAITHRPKSPGEVSLIAPYGFKKDSDAEIQIGGMKHTFFTKGGSAWAKDGTADKAIITAMAKGKDVVVKATPPKGAAISDSISLKGFSDALAAIDKACGVKR
ncbi:MAG: invasion associated locus B family protein [Rhodospirillaceae bacterium]|nr:invasion associated locus B family protein [Rhodospirillales bacterium]